jgi:hypothetical protein
MPQYKVYGEDATKIIAEFQAAGKDLCADEDLKKDIEACEGLRYSC